MVVAGLIIASFLKKMFQKNQPKNKTKIDINIHMSTL